MMKSWILAYLDAGSGSMILQMLIGGAAGVFAFLKYRWNRFRDESPAAEETREPTNG